MQVQPRARVTRGPLVWVVVVGGCAGGEPTGRALVQTAGGSMAAAAGGDAADSGTGALDGADTGAPTDTGQVEGAGADALTATVYRGSIWLELFTETGNDRCEGLLAVDATTPNAPVGEASDIACQRFGEPFGSTASVLLDPTTCNGLLGWSGVEVPFEGACDGDRITGTLDATWIDGWIEAWDRNATLCGAFEVEAE